MGMIMSFMGKGLPSSQVVSFILGTLYNKFIEKDIRNFEDFHVAILDIFNSFNSALPGKHYDVPTREQVEELFTEWRKATEESEKKELFVDFMKKEVHVSKLDAPTMITGLVTPPAAMVAKRAGENVPQLKVIKAIPDVVFVPSATVVALISVKLCRRIFQGNVEHHDVTVISTTRTQIHQPVPVAPAVPPTPTVPTAPLTPWPVSRLPQV